MDIAYLYHLAAEEMGDVWLRLLNQMDVRVYDQVDEHTFQRVRQASWVRVFREVARQVWD